MGNFMCDCSEPNRLKSHSVASTTIHHIGPGKPQESIIVTAVDHPDGQLSFRKLATIGSGAYSTVFMVEQCKQKHQLRLAMKQIGKKKLQNARLVKEILIQRTIMKEFQCEFLVGLHCAFQDQHNCYFVTELASGGDVHSFLYNTHEPEKERLFQNTREEGPKFIFACIVLAIEHLHSNGIMYRDLKPENIFVYEDGYVKLGDFGLACQASETAKNVCFAGTAGYQAPEILQRKGYGRQVDFWSMGVLLYEMIFNDLPFDAYQVSRMRYNKKAKAFESGGSWPGDKFISEEASSLIYGLLRVDPKARLGVSSWSEIKNHPFFYGFDWNKLASKCYPSPLRSIVSCFPLRTAKLEQDIDTQPQFQEYQTIEQFSFDGLQSQVR